MEDWGTPPLSNPPTFCFTLAQYWRPNGVVLVCVSQATALLARDQAQHWIEAVTGDVFSPSPFGEKLRSGVTLCQLVNVIKPGSVKKINKLSTTFMQMENVAAFLR